MVVYTYLGRKLADFEIKNIKVDYNSCLFIYAPTYYCYLIIRVLAIVTNHNSNYSSHQLLKWGEKRFTHWPLLLIAFPIRQEKSLGRC